MRCSDADADLTNAGRQSVAGGRPLQLIVQTAFPSINLAATVAHITNRNRTKGHLQDEKQFYALSKIAQLTLSFRSRVEVRAKLPVNFDRQPTSASVAFSPLVTELTVEMDLQSMCEGNGRCSTLFQKEK